jgi:hypothetical protein
MTLSGNNYKKKNIVKYFGGNEDAIAEKEIYPLMP